MVNGVKRGIGGKVSQSVSSQSVQSVSPGLHAEEEKMCAIRTRRCRTFQGLSNASASVIDTHIHSM